MSMSYPELLACVNKTGISCEFREEANAIFTGIQSLYFKHPNNEINGIDLVLQLDSINEENDCLKLIAPRSWHVPDDHIYKKNFFEAILFLQARCHFVRTIYDPSDGEVRFQIDAFMGDAALTPKQVFHLIKTIAQMIDQSYSFFSKVLNTGVLDPTELMSSNEKKVNELRAAVAAAAERLGVSLEDLLAGSEPALTSKQDASVALAAVDDEPLLD